MLTLNQKGEYPSKSIGMRAIKKENLLHESHRSPDVLTKKDKKAEMSENIVNYDFIAKEANIKWLTDIAQAPCKDGKLYIAPVMDCLEGEINSLAVADNMKKELCIQAAKDAYMIHRPKTGFLFHSDGGSQATSSSYRIELGKMHVIQSMSDVGKCYDNSRMENFFTTLKKEKTISAEHNEYNHILIYSTVLST